MLTNHAIGRDRNLFHPDYIANCVEEIDFSVLQARGIKAILIDLDGTVVSRGTFSVSRKITNHLKHQPIRIYIATNRPRSRSLRNLRHVLHADGVIHPKGLYAKPLPQYYAQAASEHQLHRSEVAMVGDRFLQDIFGANLAGLTTVLVRKLGPSQGAFDTVLSKIEKKFADRLTRAYSSD